MAKPEKGRKANPLPDMSKMTTIRNQGEYLDIYRRSVEDPDRFWAEAAHELHWYIEWDTVSSWDEERCVAKWFEGGRLNASYNCLDRHVRAGRRDKVAIIWEPDRPGASRTFTYQQLLDEVCRFANVLKKHGVKKGDRVCIYLPMIPELPIAMLACARIGAIHSVIYSGYSHDYLRDRVLASDCRTVVTADGWHSGGKREGLKRNADRALEECPSVDNVFVVRHSGDGCAMQKGRDRWWHEELVAGDVGYHCSPAVMDSEDPLFILYTSGSTGKPKGVLHTTAGYLLFTALTYKWVFDVRERDIWWATADIGWITGHSYSVYGPLANGATVVLYEGVPTYPQPDRYWRIIEKNRITHFYTEPSLVRSLMRLGDRWLGKRDLKSLRVLGLVGETTNPDVWRWFHEKVGGRRCPVVDTWWQTETGGVMISPIACAAPGKPGSAGTPVPGVVPAVIRQDCSGAADNETGFLVIKKPWPGMARTFYMNHEEFARTYFGTFQGLFYTGDCCRVDEEGNYWLQGRIDDVIKISGQRISSADVENALVGHEFVAEAAVAAMPNEIKGHGIYAFVTLRKEYEDRDEAQLSRDLSAHVRNEFGAIAVPDVIQFTPALPKTGSGKIMRRLLRLIAEGKTEDLGDTSTLANPAVLDMVISGSKDALAK